MTSIIRCDKCGKDVYKYVIHPDEAAHIQGVAIKKGPYLEHQFDLCHGCLDAFLVWLKGAE